MILPDDTEPSAEAREIADELLPKGFFADVRALLSYSLEDACEDKLRQDFALALDRFRAAEREHVLTFLRDERTAWRIAADSDAWRYNPEVAARMNQQAQAVWRIARSLADAIEKAEPSPMTDESAPTSPASAPPEMVPSPRERICAYEPLRDAGVFIRDPAIAEVSKAYRDGWNAALAARDAARESQS